MTTSRRANATLLIGAALAAVVSAGCGSGDPFAYKQVSGRVVFEDGEPLTVGKVIFQPQAGPEGEAYPRAGGANIDGEGRFDRATSYKPGDGLVAGKHKVAIMFAVDEEGNSLVDPNYTNVTTTPIEVDTADSPFEIVVKRP